MDSEKQARLTRVLAMPISRGIPRSIEEGASIGQAVAYVAGEAWNDKPACACPVLLRFATTWGEGLISDDDRTRLLRPLIPKLMSSRSTLEVQERRAWLALDWLVRARTPKWLDLAPATPGHAALLGKLQQSLSILRPICDLPSAVKAGEALHAVENEAMALWQTARPAVTMDIRRAAVEAARASAWDAGWAAWTQVFGNTVRDAAWVAAGAVAWAAAWDTMWAARAAACGASAATHGSSHDATHTYFAPTVHSLQVSASDLLARMLVVAVTGSDNIRTQAA